MSMKYLGDTLDIHTGGIDHIQVHHTNEIAQSEAATGKRFANVWMHSNHIMIEGEKVSKSLGNGIRLQEILAKGIPVAAVRLHILESHYRSQSHFSWDSLHASQNRLERWRATASQRWQVLQPSQLLDSNSISDSIEALNDLSDLNALQQHPHTSQSKDYLLQLETALLNDLNTPAGLYAIDQMMNLVENEGMTSFMLPQFVTMLQHIDRVLGIDLSDDDISDEQKQLIKDRETARINKDWVLSDKLRDQLLESEQAIILRDTPLGTIWQRL